MPRLLWNDCNGGIITTELLLIASVLVAGLLSALGTFRTSVEGEFQQLGNRIQQSTRFEEPLAPISQTVPVTAVKSFEAADLQGLID